MNHCWNQAATAAIVCSQDKLALDGCDGSEIDTIIGAQITTEKGTA